MLYKANNGMQRTKKRSCCAVYLKGIEISHKVIVTLHFAFLKKQFFIMYIILWN